MMTVDVEEWFHILELESGPGRDQWDSMETRVDRNVDQLLSIFNDTGIKATFFIVGWVARRHPLMVRRIHEEGHELASHSYWHEVIHRHNKESFQADLRTSKLLLEDLSGSRVDGFRAPGWSITPKSGWALDILVQEGFRYDSSLITGYASHGGFDTGFRGPHQIETPSGSLVEVPVASVGLGRARMPFSGGGYLRLLPYPLIRQAARKVERAHDPVCFYVHPREVDRTQPRMKLPAVRRFKYYVGLKTTENKLRRIARDFSLEPIRTWLAGNESKVKDRIFTLPSIEFTPPEDPGLVPPAPPSVDSGPAQAQNGAT